MDYELMYGQVQAVEKELRDKLSASQKVLKSLVRDSEKGEMKSIFRDLTLMRDHVEDLEALLSNYTRLLEGFDASAYMGGEFSRQMCGYGENLGVDIKGEYPVYDVFPYKIRIDAENQEIFIDKKKLHCVRPRYFIDTIKASQNRLNKAAFNEHAFLNELADAYDTAVRAKGNSVKSHGAQEILLKDLYHYLVPMQRFRREYDAQNYALDLARLYSSDAELTRDGRRFEFGSSKQPAKLIRILDGEGRERFLGTIRFVEAK